MNNTENQIRSIDASVMRLMILNAASTIENNCSKLNDLNVFPVPDGDTGSNMALTVSAASEQLRKYEGRSAGQIADIAAKAMLRGARGNSGVITSLLFKGFATELCKLENFDSHNFSHALQAGVASAYKAVANPAEGTILTVARLAADAAVKAIDSPLFDVIEASISAANDALMQTMEINPVLKKAGVVDAGGYGWVLILEAFRDAFSGIEIKGSASTGASLSSPDFSDFATEDITYTYCTEFIILRDSQANVSDLRDQLGRLGDSLVVVDDEEIIKVHVHTNEPLVALNLATSYGLFANVKIENMRLQHSNKLTGEIESDASPVPTEKYGVVAVSPGDGITEVFEELGVDCCVAGGQTMNPSTDDILAAIKQLNAENVLVLPNNKNIILAAEQARELADKNVIVIPSRSVPQGMCAMQAYDVDLEPDQLADAMTQALSQITTLQITTAVRDSDINGLNIKKDDFILLYEGELISGCTDEYALADTIIEKLHSVGRDILTVYYGCDIDESDAIEMSSRFASEFGEDNVSLIPGGQSVYRYIISAEE